MKIERLTLPADQLATGALSIDLEEWYSITERKFLGASRTSGERLGPQTDRILALLKAQEVHATFFVLGPVAERFPALVRRIHDAGHEIASHGYRHIPLHQLAPDEVQDEMERPLGLLRDITGERVEGFRAPEFSIGRANWDTLRLLASLGLRYDSSVFPIRSRRYGVPDFPRQVVRLDWPSGASLFELPLATARVAGVNLPTAGGGYYRLLPQAFLRSAVARAVQEHRSPVFYFHPYEFDDQPLRLAESPPGLRALRVGVMHWLQNAGRHRLPRRFAELLRSVPLIPCRELLDRYVGSPRGGPAVATGAT